MDRRRFLGSVLGVIAYGFLPFSFLAVTKKRWELPDPEVWAAVSFDVLKNQITMARLVRRDFEWEEKKINVEDFVSLEARGRLRNLHLGYWQISLEGE